MRTLRGVAAALALGLAAAGLSGCAALRAPATFEPRTSAEGAEQPSVMDFWSIEPFGDDTAADWAWELDRAEGWAFVDEALAARLRAAESGATGLEERILAEIDIEIAVAAGETVAHGVGNPTQRDVYTESVEGFAARVGPPPHATIERAERVLSALAAGDHASSQRFEERGYAEEWREMVRRVVDALSG